MHEFTWFHSGCMCVLNTQFTLSTGKVICLMHPVSCGFTEVGSLAVFGLGGSTSTVKRPEFEG